MKLEHRLTDAQAQALIGLNRWALSHGTSALSVALDALISAESQRRGAPEAVSGAAHLLALTQGPLLHAEYDASLHYDGWRIGGLVVDVKSLIRHNARLGFSRGDELLAAVARTLEAAFPGGKIVRIHGDAFAALLGPISGAELREGDLARVREMLEAATRSFSEGGDGGPSPVTFDFALLDLTVVAPAHVQVLGPLVWSECERALLLAKLGRASGLQRRRLVLDAAVPGEPTAT